MKRGHSNIDAKKTKPWDQINPNVVSGIACIPLQGGASPVTFKELPSLSMRKEEWEEIGRRMGWIQSPQQEQQ